MTEKNIAVAAIIIAVVSIALSVLNLRSMGAF
jgi:hypothetical protein